MKVLVTGADGFIGSHLVELLHQKGCDVRALSLYNSFNNWGWLENIECKEQIEVVIGDVRDPFLFREITREVAIVFNLAALIDIPYLNAINGDYLENHRELNQLPSMEG